jgi:hypothetical protein
VTYVKTLKNDTRYPVTAIEPGVLVARQPSGKIRRLTLKDVGRARYDAAVAHFYAEAKR